MRCLSIRIPCFKGLLLALMAAVFWVSAGWAQQVGKQTSDPEPFEMIRSLQSLQEQIAQGNSHAMQAQRALLTKMDASFVVLPADAWQEPRNARAAVIHLLSGGHPDVMRYLLSLDPAPAVDRKLMEASLAYVEGREEDMIVLLAEIDPLELPASLGGHVALVKAAPYIRTIRKRRWNCFRSPAY